MADRPVINRARSRDISSRYVRRIYRRATADLSAGIRFISATQRSSRSRRGLVNLLDAPRRQPNFFSLSLSLLFAIFFYFSPRFHPSLVFAFKRTHDWPRHCSDISSQIENSRFSIGRVLRVYFSFSILQFLWIRVVEFEFVVTSAFERIFLSDRNCKRYWEQHVILNFE